MSINISGLAYIRLWIALLHWGYAWVNKTRTYVALMITGFMYLDAGKTICVSASWWLQVKSIFIPDGLDFPGVCGFSEM